MIFGFTDDELAHLWSVAQARQSAKRGTTARDRRIDRRIDNVEMHYIGIKGEYAVATLLGLTLDYTLGVQGDRTQDLMLRRARLEVKTLQDWLVFNGTGDDRCFRADIAVLVNPHGDRPDPHVGHNRHHGRRDVVVRGWVTQKRFREKCFQYDFGYGPRTCLLPMDLIPIDALIRIARDGCSPTGLLPRRNHQEH